MNDDRPTYRLYVAGRELSPEEIDGARDEEYLHALAVAALTGQPPGTTGRIDRCAHPARRGAHAYETVAAWRVDAESVPRPDAEGINPAALAKALRAALAAEDAAPLTLARVQALAARAAVAVALEATGGNRVHAARLLGASHRQITRYPR